MADGGQGVSDENQVIEDRLLSGVTALEHLLTANLLPDDFDLEALASCDAAAAARKTRPFVAAADEYAAQYAA